MKVKGRFDHFNINVTDLDKSIKFYETALGLHESHRKEASDGSFVLVYMADDHSNFFSPFGKRIHAGCRTVCNKDKNSYLCTHAFHTGVCQGKCFPRLCRSAWSAFCVIDTSRTKNRD